MQNNHSIQSVSGKIFATSFRPSQAPAKLPVIILGAGWKDTLENNYEFAQEVAEGVSAIVVVFDYQGIGSSTGKLDTFSRKDHLNNFIAVYDWAVNLDGADPQRVGVNGGSYSGYLASLLASERAVKSLLLRAPAVFPDNSFEIPNDTDKPRPDRYFERIIETDAAPMLADALNSYKGSILVQERKGDDVITKPVIQYFLKNNHSMNQKHTVLHGASHKISGDLKKISTSECIDWFQQTL